MRPELRNIRPKVKQAYGKSKLRVKKVLSKLREETNFLRRFVWLLGAVVLLYQGWSIYAVIKLFLFLATFLFIALPFLFKYTPWIQRNLVFLPFVKWPKNVNFSAPDAEGLPATRNFYLETEPGVRVGVWHILPRSLMEEGGAREDTWYEEALADDRPVVMYLHGNSAHRAGPHRVELYQVLRQLDCHVVCFDYRGYADSTMVLPNETGVVSDAKAVYNWLVARTGSSPLLVWGHSLGTAVSSHLVADLCVEGTRPCGLVLESPFNNIFDEIRNHPMSWVWRKMPWFDWFFTDALAASDLGFVSDQRIALIDIPVLIMHAKDDVVVPFKLGKALYETALQVREPGWRKVEFEEFSEEFGYAHKFICRAPELPEIVRRFIARCSKDSDDSD